MANNLIFINKPHYSLTWGEINYLMHTFAHLAIARARQVGFRSSWNHWIDLTAIYCINYFFLLYLDKHLFVPNTPRLIPKAIEDVGNVRYWKPLWKASHSCTSWCEEGWCASESCSSLHDPLIGCDRLHTKDGVKKSCRRWLITLKVMSSHTGGYIDTL